MRGAILARNSRSAIRMSFRPQVKPSLEGCHPPSVAVELHLVKEGDESRLFMQAGEARVVLQKSQSRIAGHECPIKCVERRPDITQGDVYGRE